MSSEIVHADPSRPGTPGTELPASPALVGPIKSDNAFLRNLIEQNTKEKAVLINTIDTLQAESKSKSPYPFDLSLPIYSLQVCKWWLMSAGGSC